MQRIGYGILVSLFIAAAPVRLEEQADVKGIINRAIKAQGGEEKLAKASKAVTSKGKGKINLMGTEIEFTFDSAVQPPKQSRRRVEADFNGMKFERIEVLNGDKGWIATMGNTEDMSEDQLATAKDEVYAGWVVTLVPLKQAGFKLTGLPASKVGDRPVVGVKVSHEGHKDINLYFDKDKGLLLKIQRRVKDMTGQEVDQETFLTDYKEDNGILRARKQKTKRDGNDFLEMELTEVKPVEKLDDSTFAKP